MRNKVKTSFYTRTFTLALACIMSVSMFPTLAFASPENGATDELSTPEEIGYNLEQPNEALEALEQDLRNNEEILEDTIIGRTEIFEANLDAQPLNSPEDSPYAELDSEESNDALPFTVTKKWEDESNTYLSRPDTITVHVQAQAPLPDGYQTVEYIQSNTMPNNTQYIDTGFTPNNNTRIVADFEYLTRTNHNGAGQGYRFTGDETSTQAMFRFGTYNGTNWFAKYGSQTVQLPPPSLDALTSRNVVELDRNIFKINGRSIYAFNEQEFVAANTVHIFSANSANPIDKAPAKLYGYQIYDNDTLVRDMIPCVRTSDGTVGLYDIVNAKFYANSGGGAFSAGPDTAYTTDYVTQSNGWVKNGNVWTYTFDSMPQATEYTVYEEDSFPLYTSDATFNNPQTVTSKNATITNTLNTKDITITKKWEGDQSFEELRQTPEIYLTPAHAPDGYTQLEYIQSNGTQYIDTGFIPNQDTRVVVDFEYTKNDHGYRLTGTERRENNAAQAVPVSQAFRFGTNATNGNIPIRWRIGYGSQGTLVDDASNMLNKRHTLDMNKNEWRMDGEAFYTFDYSNNGFTGYGNIYIFDINNQAREDAVHAKLWSYKIYDNGTLVRDYIPVQKDDGTVGLYDLCEKKFYPSNNTTNFTPGPVAATQQQSVSNDSTWVKNGNTWTYTFTVPDDDTLYEAYESPIDYYDSSNEQANPANIANNTATITNTLHPMPTLAVSKTVSGNTGNKDRYFPLTLAVSMPTPINATIPINLTGAEINIPATAQHIQQTNPTAINLSNGTGTVTIWLRSNQTFTIALPNNTAYTLSEPDTDYIESYSINNGEKESGNSVNGTLQANTTVVFDNHKSTPIPTGVATSNTYTLYVILLTGLLLDAAIITAYKIRKEKRLLE